MGNCKRAVGFGFEDNFQIFTYVSFFDDVVGWSQNITVDNEWGASRQFIPSYFKSASFNQELFHERMNLSNQETMPKRGHSTTKEKIVNRSLFSNKMSKDALAGGVKVLEVRWSGHLHEYIVDWDLCAVVPNQIPFTTTVDRSSHHQHGWETLIKPVYTDLIWFHEYVQLTLVSLLSLHLGFREDYTTTHSPRTLGRTTPIGHTTHTCPKHRVEMMMMRPSNNLQ